MNNKVEIISYKHNGGLHRVWQYAYIVRQTSNMIVLVNDYPNVIDGDGRRWRTKEPAVCYFFKDHWYNIVCMLRPTGITYYCNLSSPYVKDSEGVKYIDYDLDVKVFTGGEVLELDRDEYDFNIKYLHYSEDIRDIIQRNMDILIDMIKNRVEPFNKESVYKWYNLFLEKQKNN